jgi:hypothetical protein
MFTVTRPARAYLAAGLDSANAPEGITMRLILHGESLDARGDHVRAGDVTFEHDGQIVLAIDAETVEVLEDYTLEMRETPDGSRLHLREP